jgi:hypothetical protein
MRGSSGTPLGYSSLATDPRNIGPEVRRERFRRGSAGFAEAGRFLFFGSQNPHRCLSQSHADTLRDFFLDVM